MSLIFPKRFNVLPLALLVSLLSVPTSGYSKGAPAEQCEEMVPQHGKEPQDNKKAPYKIKLSSKKIAQGKSVDVELKSKGKGTFKGFLLEARRVDTDAIIGTFKTTNKDAKYVACDGKAKTAVTHNKLNDTLSNKDSVKVKWSAPSSFTGSVKIVGTVVKEKKTFWYA